MKKLPTNSNTETITKKTPDNNRIETACDEVIDSLVEIRHKKGMSQKEVGDAAGLTQSVIARLERKKYVPQLNTLFKVALALDCTIKIVDNDKK